MNMKVSGWKVCFDDRSERDRPYHAKDACQPAGSRPCFGSAAGLRKSEVGAAHVRTAGQLKEEAYLEPKGDCSCDVQPKEEVKVTVHASNAQAKFNNEHNEHAERNIVNNRVAIHCPHGNIQVEGEQ